MKTSKINLTDWLPEDSENIEINWPKIHKIIGLDQTKWLLDKDNTKCQIVLEKNDVYYRLVAEFYDRVTLTEYYLMWAK